MKTKNIKSGAKFIFEDSIWVVNYFRYISKNIDGEKVRYYSCSKIEGHPDIRKFQKNDILNGLIER
jgi:hypothetical protein